MWEGEQTNCETMEVKPSLGKGSNTIERKKIYLKNIFWEQYLVGGSRGK